MSPSPYDWADEQSGDDYIFIDSEEMGEFEKVVWWGVGALLATLAVLAIANVALLLHAMK
jgi:hypothetical protein